MNGQWGEVQYVQSEDGDIVCVWLLSCWESACRPWKNQSSFVTALKLASKLQVSVIMQYVFGYFLIILSLYIYTYYIFMVWTWCYFLLKTATCFHGSEIFLNSPFSCVTLTHFAHSHSCFEGDANLIIPEKIWFVAWMSSCFFVVK